MPRYQCLTREEVERLDKRNEGRMRGVSVRCQTIVKGMLE